MFTFGVTGCDFKLFCRVIGLYSHRFTQLYGRKSADKSRFVWCLLIELTCKFPLICFGGIKINQGTPLLLNIGFNKMTESSRLLCGKRLEVFE